MNPLQLRLIEQKDNEALANIIRRAFHDFNAPTKGTVFEDPTTDDLYKLFSTKKAICWVALSENKIMGCCGLYPTPQLPAGCVELVKFYLLAEARGKGIGKALMKQCLKSATELGYTQVYIESLPQFKTAVGMYEKLGFTHIPQPLGMSGHTGCTIWMVKEV